MGDDIVDILSYKLSKKYTDKRMQEQQVKTAKLEQELKNYKDVMAQLNPNQEVKQSVSGYGIVSLPKNCANGQISVTALGNTYTNLLGNHGDCEAVNVFLVKGGNFVLDSTRKLYGNYSIAIDVVGNNFIGNDYSNVVAGKYYLAYASIYISRFAAGLPPSINIWDKGNFTNRITASADGTKLNQWQTIGIKFAGRNGIRLTVGTHDASSNIAYNIDGIMLVEISADEYNNLSVKELIQKYPFINGTKSTVCGFRIRSVSQDESQESTAYVLAKDAEGKILELRSLPNNVKDEFNLTQGKLIKRLDEIKLQEASWSIRPQGETTNFYSVDASNFFPYERSNWSGFFQIHNYPVQQYFSSASLHDSFDGYGIYAVARTLRIKIPKSEISGGITVEKAKQWFEQKQVTLIYQLATPIEIPAQVTGTLVGYPSGTVYLEPYVPDAGVYDGGISVLHQDLPIKAIERISKIDYETGLETELDVSKAVIATDKLSFTHPDLRDGDIVFFIYEYDRESTIGEMTVEYYDSRYIVKDTVTGKFYKWNLVVANGQWDIQLTEV